MVTSKARVLLDPVPERARKPIRSSPVASAAAPLPEMVELLTESVVSVSDIPPAGVLTTRMPLEPFPLNVLVAAVPLDGCGSTVPSTMTLVVAPVPVV